MTTCRGLTRRQALQIGAGAAALPLVHIQTAGAAGRVSIGFVDHWVPNGNEVMRKQVAAWAEKNHVEVRADFVTTIGGKIQLTAAAEAQAGGGHDAFTFLAWDGQNYADKLAPVDDVMQRLIGEYGPVNAVAEYLGKAKGHWVVVPSSTSTQYKGPCGRISLLKKYAGIDVTEMYPAQPVHAAASDNWTYDTHLKAASACDKAGCTFGIGLGQSPDSTDTAGAIFRAFGAELVDAKGNSQVRSEPVRRVLDYAQELVRYLPKDAVSYDDASNNRALISGKSALIWNPPSAWAVAKRDARQVAADCWTFPGPIGPAGRFTPYVPFLWGVWQFSPNKSAAKDLLAYLSERPQVEERCTVVDGYDVPPFDSMTDFKVWSEVEPPKGTVFNYPLRPFHHAQPCIAAAPAPPEIAVQIYSRGTMPTMFARLQHGQSVPDVVAWADQEVESFLR